MQVAERKQASLERISSRVLSCKVDRFTQQEQFWKKQVQERDDQARKRQLLDRLSTYHYMSPFKEARKKRCGSTGRWLISTAEYQDWLDAYGFQVFWLSGIMGSGKTVLNASVIDDLLTQQATITTKIVFFHVLHKNAESLIARTILRSLLRQALTIDGLRLFETEICRLSDGGCDDDEFEESSLLVLSRIRCDSYLVLDGLDEMLQYE